MLRIHLFGGFHAYDGTVPIEHFAAPKVEALFSYLLVRRGRLWSRDTLMDLFWSDAGSAEPRSCLNSSLSRLRSALGPFDRRDCLVVREGHIGLDEQRAPWLDVAEFERAVTLGSEPDLDECGRREAFERADGLYRGPLLDGLYETWSISERERLEQLHLSALEHLMQGAGRRGNHAEALSLADRLLGVDPLREDIHREAMRLEDASGRRAEAGRRYLRLRQRLRRELGIEPMRETTDLWHEISGSADDPRAPGVAIQAQLESTLRELDEIRRRVRGTLDQLRSSNQEPLT